MLILVSDNVQMQFNSCFSDGDFVKISVGRREAPVKESTMSVEEGEAKDDVDVDEQSPKLFTCPVDGCVKLFQRYSSLEYHLQCGTCDIVPERENLFDLARIIYRDKLCMILPSHQSSLVPQFQPLLKKLSQKVGH